MFQSRSTRLFAAEVLACAVTDLFPSALLVAGGATDSGFFYTFVFPDIHIDASMFPMIEERMYAILREKPELRTSEMLRTNAAEMFNAHDQPLRADYLLSLDEKLVPILHIGKFYDYSEAGIEGYTDCKVFQLHTLENITCESDFDDEPDSVRIDGAVFSDKSQLKEFKKRRQQAELRDPVKLGQELRLFAIDETDDGIYWFPKGTDLRNRLLDRWRALQAEDGCAFVQTPTSFDSDPHLRHCQLLQRLGVNHAVPQPRFAEIAELIEEESVGPPLGLYRTNTTTKDCETIFCLKEQVVQEVISSLQFIEKSISIYGLKLQWRMDGQAWAIQNKLAQHKKALEVLRQALKEAGIDFEEGDFLKFSGPHIYAAIEDCLGRKWSGPYVGIGLEYMHAVNMRVPNGEGKDEKPWVICRSVFGSIERTIGLLLETTSGCLPLWLAPEQVRVVPIGEKNKRYAVDVQNRLVQEGFRASTDLSFQKLGAKIFDAETAKVPFIAVVGDKEELNNKLTVRRTTGETVEKALSIGEFLEQLQETEEPIESSYNGTRK